MHTHSTNDSVDYDLVKTTLSESEADEEDQTKHNARFRALWLIRYSASASESDNLVLRLDH